MRSTLAYDNTTQKEKLVLTTTEQAVQVGKADALGFDPDGGPWVTVCTKHSTVLNTKSRDQARAAAKNTAAFCEDCRDSQMDERDMERFENGIDEHTQEQLEMERFEPTSMESTDEPDTGGDMALSVHDVQQLITPPSENDQKPILGTFHANSTPAVHNAVAVQGLYFTAACGPSMLMGEAATQDDPGMCTYCLSGITAPDEAKAKKVKIRKITTPAEPKAARVKKVAPEPEPEPEPKYTDLTDTLNEQLYAILDALTEDSSLPDARRAMELLESYQAKLKPMLPRRTVGRPTGARSGLVRQSATVNPSDELGKVQAFADDGDKRANDILEHVKAYEPGVDCSYCLAKGRSTRHGYATAFCSIGRELRAMEQRAANGQ